MRSAGGRENGRSVIVTFVIKGEAMGLGDDMVEVEATREERERCVRLLVGRASCSTHPGYALALAALIAGGPEAYHALASTGGLGWGAAVTELEKHCTSRFSHDKHEEMKKQPII